MSLDNSLSLPLESVCWMTSDLIKAHNYCHLLPPSIRLPNPQPLTETKMQESAAVTVTFWRLHQIKESSRIIFCMSCPYPNLAPVCLKLHGRATEKGVEEEQGRIMQMERCRYYFEPLYLISNVQYRKIISCNNVLQPWLCHFISWDQIQTQVALFRVIILLNINKLLKMLYILCSWEGLVLHKGS